jgi:hypothetical protein
MAEQIKFRGPDKKKFSDDEHTADFLAAEQYKKVYLGKLALYYKDFWRKICVPYDCITRAYKGISVVMPDDHPAIEYFRLILRSGEKEIANIIFGEKDSDLVDDIVHRIHMIHPETETGYAEPPKPAKKVRK